MGKFAVGEVVLVSFPFSNLQGQKIRPALILAKAEFGDFILCQITSKPYKSKIAIRIELSDFAKGKLPAVIYVRPDKLFTADSSIIRKKVGQLTLATTKSTLKNVREMFSS